MRSFQKVTVEASKKVTVLARLLSSCLLLGVPNVEGKASNSCSALSMLVARVKFKEEPHSSLIQTGASSSLNFNLVHAR